MIAEVEIGLEKCTDGTIKAKIGKFDNSLNRLLTWAELPYWNTGSAETIEVASPFYKFKVTDDNPFSPNQIVPGYYSSDIELSQTEYNNLKTIFEDSSKSFCLNNLDIPLTYYEVDDPTIFSLPNDFEICGLANNLNTTTF